MGLLDTLQGIQGRREEGNQTGRFDTQIAETERQIKEQYAKIGEGYLRKHWEDYEEEFGGYAGEVRRLMEEKKLLERDKLAAQGLRLCESCQQTIPLDSMFCNKCGAKMEPMARPASGGRHCPSCGAPIGQGDTFCMECGAKIG